MNNFFVREEGLMPEQEQVLLKAMARKASSEIICVQGVAGSGKTTIALSLSLQLGKRNKSRARDHKQTVLFLTYNQSLADACYQALKDKPDLDGVLTSRGQLQPGMVNVLTIQELFKLGLPDDMQDQTLEDIDCIGKISAIAVERGITDLLPSQIFALITTFLRGRKELIWKKDTEGNFTKEPVRVADLGDIITQYERRSSYYRVYRESLQRISRYLLGTYEDWKGEKLDRSGIARVFYETIALIEQDLMRLKTIKAEEYRRLWLGDRDLQLTRIAEWIGTVLLQYQEISDIEASAKQFADIFLEKHINEKELNELRHTLTDWTSQYGLRADPLWSSLLSRIPNPVIVIDEVQDLSSIECENLISLWFQLARTQESRMVLLGDLNQQMTPSGFEWDLLVDLIKAKQELYQGKSQHPDIHDPLDWNFRTTPQIAKTVASMLGQVAKASLAQLDARRLLEHSIDPEKTILGDNRLSEMVEKIKIESGEIYLIPRLLVGSAETFESGLDIYLNRLLNEQEEASEDRVFSSVIITEHASELKNLLDNFKQKSDFPTSVIEIIPVLSCKGLEFDRCVLYGINRLEQGDVTIDLVSRWYTSFTRARVQLLVYLTPEEYEFILGAGWKDIESSVILEQVNNPDKVADELHHIGMTELDDSLLVVFGERAFIEFLANPGNEKPLEQSLDYFRKANRLDYFQKSAKQAAELFESQKKWEKAAGYYGLADDVIKEANCLYKASIEYREYEDLAQADHLKNLALKRISSLPNERILDKAFALIAIEEVEQALSEIKTASETIKEQVAREIYRLANISEDRNQRISFSNVLQKYGYYDQAASIFMLVGELRSALSCVVQPGAKTIARIAEEVYTAANGWIAAGRISDVAQIAGQLDACGQHRYAGDLFAKIGDPMLALKAYIKSGDLRVAEFQANLLNTQEAYQLLGSAYKQVGRDDWDSAYYWLFKSGNVDEIRQMEKDLRDNQLFLKLGNGFKRTGQKTRLEELANELNLKEQYDVSARCWELAEGWYQACEAWYQTYYYFRENFERLLGHEPGIRKPNPAILNRFYEHLEKNQERYQYLPESHAEEPSAFHGGTKESVLIANRIVMKISDNQNWRADLEMLINEVRRSIRRAGLATTGEYGLSLPHEVPINEDRLRLFWDSIIKTLDLYRARGQEIAREQFHMPGKELEGLQMMFNICHLERSTEEMANELRNRRDMDGRKLWVRSWAILERKHDQIERELNDLHPIKDAELILYAIDVTYPNDKRRREALRVKYRTRLEGLNDPRARRLLNEHFPGYKPRKADHREKQAREDIKRGDQAQSGSLVELLKELDNRARPSIRDDDNLQQFDMYMKKLLHEPEKLDKLELRWRRTKECLPESPDPELIQLMDQIREAIEMEMTKSEPIEEAQTGKTPETVLQGDSQPTPSQPLPKAEIQLASRPRRSRKKNKTKLSPFLAEQIRILNLHEYNLEDAMIELNGDLQSALSEATIRCLAIIHGYGKHATNLKKPMGIIKESVRTRLKQFQIDHRSKVYRVIYGESLDSSNQDLFPILEACQDVPSEIKGGRNEGITIVIFK